MTKRKRKNSEVRRMQRMETFILLGVCTFVLISPLILRPEGDLEWDKTIDRWKDMMPFLFLLLLNHFVLIPTLFFKKKRVQFIMASLLLICSIGLLKIIYPGQKKGHLVPPPGLLESVPPHETHDRPPLPETFDRTRPPGPKGNKGRRSPFPPVTNAIVISILILLIDTGYRSSFRLVKTEYDHNQLEKENIKNRLSILKNQVSPHFFMNTLNNVHALIEVNPKEAQEAIIKLSKLMRAMLLEPDSGKIQLRDEIIFQKNYVELMGIRYNDKLELKADYPSDIPDIQIPPLLFTSLIENAFKYGVSYKSASFIHISMKLEGENLKFEIANSNHKQGTEASHGIGLKNIHDRLNLLYQSNYELAIDESEDKFKVKMSIPV